MKRCMEKVNDIILEMKDIVKDFPGVRALDGVNFEAKKGEILALVGENGAGKSTLMKILSGVYPYKTYEGEGIIYGERECFYRTLDAQQKGIAIIHQELNLIPKLSVAENIFLGNERTRFGVIDYEQILVETKRVLKKLGIELDPETKIIDLGIGKQQMVEIAKALRVKAQILILDEPTSALSDKEIKLLFDTLRALKEQGVTSIYISHKLEEVFEISERIVVLRDGKTVGGGDTSKLTIGEVVAMMVGRKIEEMFPKEKPAFKDVLLKVKNFSVNHPFLPGEKVVQDINFEVRAGEVLGIAGLMGSGRSELVTALFGAFPADTSGEIYIRGKKVKIKSPYCAIREGIGLATEDRKQFGLILQMSVKENISIAMLKSLSRFGIIDEIEDRKLTERFVDELKIKTPDIETKVDNLSGGNQQKVILARWLATNPKILILDEPTRGVDVGAKVEIYKIMNELAGEGIAIIMVSSSLPEVLKMSDRILVMKEGELKKELNTIDATQELIMRFATG